MENPFYKRATEYLRDNDEFLSIVTPEPVLHFLQGPAQSGRLYDRLVRLKLNVGRMDLKIAPSPSNSGRPS